MFVSIVGVIMDGGEGGGCVTLKYIVQKCRSDFHMLDEKSFPAIVLKNCSHWWRGEGRES